MDTFILIHNPTKSEQDYSDVVMRSQAGESVDGRWSLGSRRGGIACGDRAFLLRLGPIPDRGIVASARFTSTVFERRHWADRKKMATYANLTWDIWVEPRQRLPVEHLQARLPAIPWSGGFRGSGVRIASGPATRLARLWDEHLATVHLAPGWHPDEGPPTYTEGDVTTVRVNRYERDPRARAACIAKHGTACAACGFDFEAVYGALGKGYVEVHHVEGLAFGGRRETEPGEDLIPLCPNCQAMVHKGANPARSVARLKQIISRTT